VINLKTVTVDKLIFKEKLSTIEQLSLKAILFKWVGEPTEGLDDFLPLEYIEHDFAKMKAKEETDLLIQGDQPFRYVTLTENNQIVIAVLDSNKKLKHIVISLEEI
jgi:hypothetical protein